MGRMVRERGREKKERTDERKNLFLGNGPPSYFVSSVIENKFHAHRQPSLPSLLIACVTITQHQPFGRKKEAYKTISYLLFDFMLFFCVVLPPFHVFIHKGFWWVWRALTAP
jgi:hypothetical protein